MYNYNKSVLSPYHPTKLALHSILRPEDDLISNFGPNVRKAVSFDEVVHFIDEENIVNYVDFDCGNTFLPETPTKVREINQPRTELPFQIPWKVPVHSQQRSIICSVEEQHSSNIFLNPYILWNMAPAAFISLNRTNGTYSMSNQYPEPTFHQSRTDSYPAFSSLRTMDSKRKGLRASFAFFHRNYLPDGQVNETVATVEELSDLWKPGAMDGIPPFVMNCNCI